MKKLLLAIFSLISVISYSQTTGYLRYDTVRIQRGGGNSTLVIENATRTLTNGFLQNYSEGRTKFAHALDSVWIDGDSIRFRYGTTTLAVVVPASYTDADARAAISLTTTGTSGAATYDNGTGVFNIPNYQGGGISEVIAGYGLTNVNDSTLDVDSLVIANRDWVMDRIDDAGLGGGVSGLTQYRTPYAASSTSLADHANYIIFRNTPGLQGHAGFSILAPVVIGGPYNLPQNRNFDYASNGNKSYGLEIVHDKSIFDADSTSPGAFAITTYSGSSTGGNSFHSRAARGTQASPTQVLSGDRLYSLGAKGYTSSNYFANSSFAIIATADENFTASANGTSATIEVTPAGASSRVTAMTFNNNGSVTTGSSLTTTTGLTVGSSAIVTNSTTTPILYGSSGANGSLTIKATSNASEATSKVYIQPTGGTVTIGTTTTAGIFTTQSTGNDTRWQMNNTDVTLPSYSAFGFSPAIATGTTFMVAPFSGTSGGAQMFGFTESGANTMSPISMVGFHGGTSPTAAAVRFTGSKHNGTTSTSALASTEILAQFQNNGATNLMTLLGGGNLGIGTVLPDRLLHPEISDATTNTIVYPFRMSHTTSGTAAIGGGVGMEMETENASGTMRVTGSVTNPMTDATNASEDADYTINLIRAGTLTEGFRVTSVGGVTVNGAAGTAGQVLTSGGTGAASTWTNAVKPTLTKNATIESPTSSENMGWFRTPVAITITNTHAVLVGTGTPSVTYQISFGTDITSLTNVYTAGQTVTSTTTGDAASGVNDATIPANSWVRITTSASTTTTQISLSITYTED